MLLTEDVWSTLCPFGSALHGRDKKSGNHYANLTLDQSDLNNYVF